jgi:hypothetical protein
MERLIVGLQGSLSHAKNSTSLLRNQFYIVSSFHLSITPIVPLNHFNSVLTTHVIKRFHPICLCWSVPGKMPPPSFEVYSLCWEMSQHLLERILPRQNWYQEGDSFQIYTFVFLSMCKLRELFRRLLCDNCTLGFSGPWIRRSFAAGATSLWLRQLLLFQGIWVQFPTCTWHFTIICDSSSTESNTFLISSGTRYVCYIHP